MTGNDLDHERARLADQLAAAAEQVTVGPIPYADVLHGGRRRRRRRWAAAAAGIVTALATAVGGGVALVETAVWKLNEGELAPVVVSAPPPPTKAPDAQHPVRMVLGRGHAAGQDFEVEVEIWGAATTETEAWDQIEAMVKHRTEIPIDIDNHSFDSSDYSRERDELPFELGKSWFFVYLTVDGERWLSGHGHLPVKGKEAETYMTGAGLAEDKSTRLLAGWTRPTVGRVVYHWKDGSISVPQLQDAPGSNVRWFVVVGPEGVASESMDTYDLEGHREKVDSPEFN